MLRLHRDHATGLDMSAQRFGMQAGWRMHRHVDHHLGFGAVDSQFDLRQPRWNPGPVHIDRYALLLAHLAGRIGTRADSAGSIRHRAGTAGAHVPPCRWSSHQGPLNAGNRVVHCLYQEAFPLSGQRPGIDFPLSRQPVDDRMPADGADDDGIRRPDVRAHFPLRRFAGDAGDVALKVARRHQNAFVLAGPDDDRCGPGVACPPQLIHTGHN